MKKHHPKNERIKRRYFDYLKEAKRMDVSSVDLVAASIAGFEQWSNYRDFASFHIEQAKGYKAYLAKQRNANTGNAVASFRLKHIDLAAKSVFQDARDVRTKSRKTFTTFFFPVGEDVEAVLSKWIDHLKAKLWFGPDDPLFPSTKVALTNAGLFGAVGLSRDHWKNASAIRRIFKSAFEAAGLPYANPHSLRNTLAMLGLQRCRTPEAFKAWSQNLGHEQVLTTFTSYGTVATSRQAEIITGLKEEAAGADRAGDDFEQLAALVERMRKKA